MPAPANARAQTFDRYSRHINPARINLLSALGMDLVAERSEGYRVFDVSGRDFLDLDLRAGVYNLGHRNPVIDQALRRALDTSDMGFAMFPGENQGRLAELLSHSTGLPFTLFAASGTEANDMAIQVARRVTGRRRILSSSSGYHGATGLSSALGNPEFSKRFNSAYPQDFGTFENGNIHSVEGELQAGDVAAVVVESSCNAAGYPAVDASFWSELRSACDRSGALLIMDEIVTGLGRSGFAWGFQKVGIAPDIAVSAKGLSGGIYPIAAAMLSERAGQWLRDDFAGFAGTYAGGELACAVGIAALELSTSDVTLARVNQNSAHFGAGLRKLVDRFDSISEVREFGLLFGLKIDGQEGGISLISHLFQAGILTFPASNAPNVVNLKLGHLVDERFCDEALARIEHALSAFEASL